MGMTTFAGARVVDVDGVRDAWVRVRGSVIDAVGHGEPALDEHALVGPGTIVDASGLTLVPGFIDLHGHGGGRVSVEDGQEALGQALAAHRAHGTTRQVLSAVSAPIPELCRTLAMLADLTEADPLVLGSHAEGPFLSPVRKGAHDPSALTTPTPASVDSLLAAARGTLRQVTIAPEIEGGLDAVRRFAEVGVAPAVGHTEADYALARAAFDAGASILTHAFNAMPPMLHRAPGPVAAAVEREDVTLELVLDGMHVHPAVASLLMRSARGRVALVTDAMAAAGAEDGAYRLGSLDVTVTGGCAFITGTETIAGSTLTQDVALRLAVASGIELSHAVGALTAVPAAAIGEQGRLGRIAPHYAGDIVLLDDSLTVRQVWADGQRIV